MHSMIHDTLPNPPVPEIIPILKACMPSLQAWTEFKAMLLEIWICTTSSLPRSPNFVTCMSFMTWVSSSLNFSLRVTLKYFEVLLRFGSIWHRKRRHRKPNYFEVIVKLMSDLVLNIWACEGLLLNRWAGVNPHTYTETMSRRLRSFQRNRNCRFENGSEGSR